MAFESLYYRKIKKTLQFILSNIEFISGKTLDIFCDTGIVACFIAKMRSDIDVTAVSTDMRKISIAKQLAFRLKIKNN